MRSEELEYEKANRASGRTVPARVAPCRLLRRRYRTNGIPAAAFSSGNVLTLPVKATLNEGDYVSYGGHQFTSTKALSKMADLITKNNDTVTAASYTNAHGDCWLFSKQTTTGTDYWCLYQSDPGGAKNQYIFSGMHRILTLSAGEGDLDLLMPLHLISDSYIRDNMGSRLTLDKEYSCGVQEADSTVAELFRAFYQSAGLYRITASGDGFTLALNDVSSQLLLRSPSRSTMIPAGSPSRT